MNTWRQLGAGLWPQPSVKRSFLLSVVQSPQDSIQGRGFFTSLPALGIKELIPWHLAKVTSSRVTAVLVFRSAATVNLISGHIVPPSAPGSLFRLVLSPGGSDSSGLGQLGPDLESPFSPRSRFFVVGSVL